MAKIIFVDFDDTLCLHRFNIYIDERMFEETNKACEMFYAKSELNLALYKYLTNMQKDGAKIILLTSACSKMLDIKKYWIEKNCPLAIFDDYIAVSIDINKAQIMIEYARHNKIDISEIIFIDDNCTERKYAQEKGILTYNPQLIMNNKGEDKL